jgi:glycosyltransferase involved in cell wall biosynthesis
VEPRVSVVIPVYNGSNYLAQAIDSALAQTWPNVEVLVVDDGSDDGGATARIAQSYGDRIRFLQRGHGGVAAALNTGIREMRGDCFAWLSHDDVYLPHKLERQVRALLATGPDAIVYSDYELVGPDLRHIKTKALPHIPPACFRLWLMTEAALHGCTLLVPRHCFDDVTFDERLSTTQDYDMWFRLARRFRFVHIPEVLLRYRIHGRQESWTNKRRAEEADRLLLGFLAEISPREIVAVTDEPPGRIYMRAAVRYKLRGWTAAAARALELSGRETRSMAERIAPRRLALLLAYALANPRFLPMEWWKRLHFRGSSADPADGARAASDA